MSVACRFGETPAKKPRNTIGYKDKFGKKITDISDEKVSKAKKFALFWRKRKIKRKKVKRK